MESIHADDPIGLPYQIWIPVETVVRWNDILDAVCPKEEDGEEKAAPLFSTEPLANEFIEALNPYFTIGDYVPEPLISPNRLLEYLDACESQGFSYVIIDPTIGAQAIKGRFRRIVALRKHLLNDNAMDGTAD